MDASTDDCSKDCWVSHHVVGSSYAGTCSVCYRNVQPLWFQKPLDIRDPTWMDTSEFEDLLALMLVRNYGFGTRVRTHDQGYPVPIKSVQHIFSNGSESAYLHLYPTYEKNRFVNATAIKIHSSSSPDLLMQAPAPHWSSSTFHNVVVHHEVAGFDYSLGPSLHGPAVCSLMSGQALECGVGPAMSVHNVWGGKEEHQHGGHLQISLTKGRSEVDFGSACVKKD